MSSPRADGFNPRLESLRGLAAMMVAFGNAFLVLDARISPGFFHVFNRQAVVSLFFVLSGYVLGLSLRRAEGPVGREYVRFGIRRIFRIYPAFVIGTLFVLIGLRPFPGGLRHPSASAWFNQFYQGPVTTTELQENLLMASSSLNYVTWTLRVEVVGSLLLAGLHWAGRALPAWGKAGVLGVLVGWALAEPTGWLSPYLFMFYLGYLLPAATRWLGGRWGNNPWVSSVALGMTVVVFLGSRQTSVASWGAPFAAALLLVCLLEGVRFRFYRFLEHPWTRFYGRISYSFFLLHFPILCVTAGLLMEAVPGSWLRAWPHLASFALAMISSLAATLPAWALYAWVERPGIALSKRITGARETAASAVPSVLFLNRVYPPADGATGQLLSELAPALVQAGWTVTVVTSRPNRATPKREVRDGVRIERVTGLPFTRGRHWQRALCYVALYPGLFWRAWRVLRADVVVVMTDPPLLVVFAVVLCGLSGARLVHWAQDLYPELAEQTGLIKRNGLAGRGLRALSTWALRGCDCVVAVGQCMRARLLARGLEPERVFVIPNWAPQAEEMSGATECERFRREHGVADRFVVMYSGNFGLAHSFGPLFEAAEIVQATEPAVMFVLVGHGPQRPWVEEQTRARGLSNVRFLPFQPKERLYASLGSAELHLASMRPELCGLVVPSKIYGIVAAGRPCLFLGPHGSEAARLIEENGSGEVLEAASGVELARRLTAWVRDPQRLKAAAARCCQLRASLSIEPAIDSFLEVLHGVGRPSRPEPDSGATQPAGVSAGW